MALDRTPVSELRSVTCRMGSHSVICCPIQVSKEIYTEHNVGENLTDSAIWRR